MSTRWYPLYAKGNPQLRVFLPNFWMKLIKPKIPIRPNCAQFIVSMEMTSADVKNYLEKIYNITVVDVRTKVFTGQLKRAARGFLIKDDDYRKAYVTMENNFQFPDLFPPNERTEKLLQDQLNQKKLFDEKQLKNQQRQDIPNWFAL